MKVIEEDETEKSILIVLNDNAQDGTDDPGSMTQHRETHEEYYKAYHCYGQSYCHMALRLKYGGYTGALEVQEQMKEAALLKSNETMYAIRPTLQPVRNLLLTQGVQERKGGA